MPEAASDAGRARIPRSARALRRVVMVLLAVSTVLTLVWLPALREGVASGRWPRALLAVPPALLGAFIVGYALYRLALVRAGRYSPGKALAQVGLMVLALVLVAHLALEPAPSRGEGRLERALHAGNPDERALAAEVARYRTADEIRPLVPRLIELLADPDPDVRREAHATLVAVAGEDLGSGEGAAARWRTRFGEPSGTR